MRTELLKSCARAKVSALIVARCMNLQRTSECLVLVGAVEVALQLNIKMPFSENGILIPTSGSMILLM